MVLSYSTTDVIRGNIIRSISGPISGSNVLVYDMFTDTNGTALDAHTPDIDVVSGGWTRDVLAMEINDANECGLDNTKTSIFISSIDCGESDVIITDNALQKRSGLASANSHLIARFSNTSNYILAGVSTQTTTPWTWAIMTVIGGSTTVRASAQGITGGTANATPEIKVTLSGDSIQLEVASEGIDLSYSTTFNNTVTRHGIRLFQSSGGLLPTADNFKIVKN